MPWLLLSVLPGQIKTKENWTLYFSRWHLPDSGAEPGLPGCGLGHLGTKTHSSQTAWTRTKCLSHLCPWKYPCFVCKRQAREILPHLGSPWDGADGILSLGLPSYSHPPPWIQLLFPLTTDCKVMFFSRFTSPSETHSLSFMLMICPAPQGPNTTSHQYFFSKNTGF